MTQKLKTELEHAYNISITGRHVHVTDSMKEYAKEKISKIDRISHRIIDVWVTMDIQKLDHKVDIVLKVDHIKIKVQATTNDMYASIDKASDKLQTKLRKYKDRIQNHQAKGLAVIDMNVNVVKMSGEEETIEELNDDIEEENRRQLEDSYKFHEIVNHEQRPLKLLTYDEAIMKMELSGDSFLVFRNEEDQKLRVIYRREDGNYGIIDVE